MNASISNPIPLSLVALVIKYNSDLLTSIPYAFNRLIYNFINRAIDINRLLVFKTFPCFPKQKKVATKKEEEFREFVN